MPYVDNSQSPGNLFKSYSVICGLRPCKNVLNHVSDDKKYAESDLRRLGWKKTTKNGWVCPICAANINPKKHML